LFVYKKEMAPGKFGKFLQDIFSTGKDIVTGIVDTGKSLFHSVAPAVKEVWKQVGPSAIQLLQQYGATKGIPAPAIQQMAQFGEKAFDGLAGTGGGGGGGLSEQEQLMMEIGRMAMNEMNKGGGGGGSGGFPLPQARGGAGSFYQAASPVDLMRQNLGRG
jgi:hypothetical protein